MAPGRAGRRELLVAVLLLGALGAAAFGSQVANGGFYWDDWKNAATTEYPPEGYLGPFDLGLASYRPILALALPIPYLLFGETASLHLALAVALGVLTSASLYLLLRTAAVPPLPAALTAALALTFPWSDSTRLWATGSINNLAVIFCLLGAVAGLRGLEAEGRRRRVLQVAAALLFVLGVLVYEVVVVAALASVALYATRSGWRRAVSWWWPQALAIAAATLLVALSTTRERQSLGGSLAHAREIGDGSLTLLARAAAPFGSPPRLAVLLVIAAVFAAAGLAAARLPAEQRQVGELRRWLVMAAAGALGVAAGYAMFVPGADRYHPLGGGTANRVNVLAGLGFATVVVAALMALATLVAHRWSAGRGLAHAAAAAIALAIGAGYLLELDRHKHEWSRAAAMQEQVLAALRQHVPEPPHGATIYTVGHPAHAGTGVPVFAVSWDLDGAAKLALRDPSIAAYPLSARSPLACEEDRVRARGALAGKSRPAPYGRTLVVDVRTGSVARPGSRAACRRQAASITARAG